MRCRTLLHFKIKRLAGVSRCCYNTSQSVYPGGVDHNKSLFSYHLERHFRSIRKFDVELPFSAGCPPSVGAAVVGLMSDIFLVVVVIRRTAAVEKKDR